MKKLLLLLLLACSSITTSYSQGNLDQHFLQSWRIMRQSRAMPLSVAAEELSSSWTNWGMLDFGQIPRISSDDIDLTTTRNNLLIWRDSYAALGASIQLFKGQNPIQVDYNRNMAYIHFVTGHTYGVLASLFDQAYVYDFENMLPDYDLKSHQEVLKLSIEHFESARAFAEAGNFSLPSNWINGNDISDEDFIKVINTYAARFIMNSSRGNDDVDWEKVIALLNDGIEEDISIQGDGNLWWARTLIQGHDPLWTRVSQRVVNMMANDQTKNIGGVYPYPDGVSSLPPIISNDKRFENYFEYKSEVNFRADRGYYFFSNYRLKRYDEYVESSFLSRMPEIDLIEKELMLAEAFLNVGRTQEALVIINRSREIGELDNLANSISNEELFSYLQYEKTLASFGHDMAYFDKRRWGTLYPDTFKKLPIPSESENIEAPRLVEVSKPFNGVKNFPIDGLIEVSIENGFSGLPTHQSDLQVDVVISQDALVSFVVPISATTSTGGMNFSFKLGDYINLRSEEEYSLNISLINGVDSDVSKIENFQLQTADFDVLDRWSKNNTLMDPMAGVGTDLVKSFEDDARIINVYSNHITEFNKTANEWNLLANAISTNFPIVDLAAYGNDILFLPSVTSLSDKNSNMISVTESDDILYYDFTSNNWVLRENEKYQGSLGDCFSCTYGNGQGVFYTYLNRDDNKIVVKRIIPGGNPVETIYSDTPVQTDPDDPEMIFANSEYVFLGGDNGLIKIEFDSNYETVKNVTDLHQIFIDQLQADGLGSENLHELFLEESFKDGRGAVSAYSPDGNELYMSYMTDGEPKPTHFYFDGVNWQILFDKEIDFTGDFNRWYGEGGNAFVTASLVTGSNIHWFSNGEQFGMGKLAPSKINRLFEGRLVFQNESFTFSGNLPEEEELDTSLSQEERLNLHFNQSWGILRRNLAMPFSVAAEELSSSWGNWGMRDFGQIPRISSDDIDVTSSRNNLQIWESSYSNLGESVQLFKVQNPSHVDYNRNMAYIHYVTGYTYGILASLFDEAYLYDFENMSPIYDLKPYQEILATSMEHFERAKVFAEAGDFSLPSNWINGNAISNEDFIKLINTHAARFIMNSSRGNDDVDWEKVIVLLNDGIEKDFSIQGDGNIWWSRTLIQGQMSLWARVSQRVVNMMADESTKDIGGVYPYPDGVSTLPSIVSNDKRFENYFEYDPAIQFSTDYGYHFFSNYRFKRYDEFLQAFTGKIPEIDLTEKELMLAEALLNVGRTQEALVIINRSREIGELDDLASSISNEELFSYLQYEKTLASFGHGVAYFDKRRWETLYPDTFKKLPIPSENNGLARLEVSKPFNGVKNFPIDGSMEVSFYNKFNGMPTHQGNFGDIQVDAVISQDQVVSFNVPLNANSSVSYGDPLSQSFKLEDYIDLSSEKEYSFNISLTNPIDLSISKAENFQLKMADFNTLNRWSGNIRKDPLAERDIEPVRSFEDADRVVNIYSDHITEFNKTTREWRVLASSISKYASRPLSNPAVGYGNNVLFIPGISSLTDTYNSSISVTESDDILFFDFTIDNWVLQENERYKDSMIDCHSCTYGNTQGVFYTYLNRDDNKIVVKKITPGGNPIETIYNEPPAQTISRNLEMIFVEKERVFIGGDKVLIKIEYDSNYEEPKNTTDLHQVFTNQLQADGLGSKNLHDLFLAGSFANSRGAVSAYSPDGDKLYMSYKTFNEVKPSHFYFDGVNWQVLFNKDISYTGDVDRWYGEGANAFVSADIITGSNIHWFLNGEQLGMGKLAPGKVSRLFEGHLVFQDENFDFSDNLPEVEGLGITGELKVGENLEATYTYTDIDGDEEAGTTFEWLRASAADGTGEKVIDGATSETYVLSDDDFGMFIKVRITPRNAKGQGRTKDSEYVGLVKKSQIISFNTLPNKTYGEVPFNLVATSDAGAEVSFESSDPSIASVSGETVTIHASGNVDIIAKQAGNDFYDKAEEVRRNLTIEKTTLTATAEDKSKIYGADNPELTISYSGFVNGDDTATITEPSISTIADATSDVGTYDITLTDGASTNYNISNTNGTLTINQTILTVTADDKSKIYGADNPELTISYSGFVNGEGVGAITPPTVSTNADKSTGVGAIPITLSGGSSGNYSLITNSGLLTINPASLTATAQDETINKGDGLPTFTVSYHGFVNEEDESVLTTVPSASTTVTTSSDRGNYPINVSDGVAENYNIMAVSGTLTVTGPVYNLPTAITFDVLALGDTDAKDIDINNTGDGELNISAIALPVGYTVNQNTLNIAEGTNGSITITFNPTAAQVYSGDITISSNNGEETISVNGEGQIVTSIDDERLDIEEVKIFPNPSSDWIMIDLKASPAKEANLSLVNAQGISAWQQMKVTENEVRVDVSTFSSGLYLLMVETNKGIVIKKVMVRH